MEHLSDFQSEWQKIENMLTQTFGAVPDFEGILYLVGINELQNTDPTRSFSKDEKEDLIHVGICTLLQKEGYYRFTKFDDEGWPHFDKLKKMEYITPAQQELMLKKAMIEYFNL